MITITHLQARRLRCVFRRHPLGIAHKGPVPPLVFRAGPSGLRVRHHQPGLAVECLLPGEDGHDGAIALPLDALADLEGRDEVPVVLEPVTPTRTLASWQDRGIPQAREYAVPDLATLPPFPAPPPTVGACPGDLLDALAEAAATTDAGSTRYTLGCVQLRGSSGEVVATDGRQILIQGGFRLPWEGDVLVPATPLFACRDLPRDRTVDVGRTDTHVAVRAGAWTAWMAIRADGRFPRIEHAIPDADAPATRLRLAAGDAAFLVQALGRLPGGDAPNAPLTLDLNGRVAVRARAASGGGVTEVVLARSGFTGDPVRVVTNRQFLARALRLGFGEVRLGTAEAPIACRDGRRVYLWQPLSADAAIAPSEDAVTIDSASTGPTSRPPANPPTPQETMPVNGSTRDPRSATPPVTPASGGGGLTALIAEATALHDVLADAKSRALRLAGALRRHRKQARLTQSTLAALRQLGLQEVAE